MPRRQRNAVRQSELQRTVFPKMSGFSLLNMGKSVGKGWFSNPTKKWFAFSQIQYRREK